MLVTPSGMFMLAKLLHPEKAPAPMLVTPSGILMLVKRSHAPKASSSMLVTPSGIFTLIKSLAIKAPYPILVTVYIFPSIRTLSGIVMES